MCGLIEHLYPLSQVNCSLQGTHHDELYANIFDRNMTQMVRYGSLIVYNLSPIYHTVLLMNKT